MINLTCLHLFGGSVVIQAIPLGKFFLFPPICIKISSKTLRLELCIKRLRLCLNLGWSCRYTTIVQVTLELMLGGFILIYLFLMLVYR